jgi:hypothetical protein
MLKLKVKPAYRWVYPTFKGGWSAAAHCAPLPPLLPGLVTTYSITNDPLGVLETIDLAARRLVLHAVPEPHGRPAGQHHSGRGPTVRPVLPGLCRSGARRERRSCRCSPAYTSHPTTVSRATARAM